MPDIYEGILQTPAAVLPIVLRSMKEKVKEWGLAKYEFNQLWRDSLDKNYLKSLDLQSVSFKVSNGKKIKTRSILRDIKVVVDEVCKLTSLSAYLSTYYSYFKIFDS